MALLLRMKLIINVKVIHLQTKKMFYTFYISHCESEHLEGKTVIISCYSWDALLWSYNYDACCLVNSSLSCYLKERSLHWEVYKVLSVTYTERYVICGVPFGMSPIRKELVVKVEIKYSRKIFCNWFDFFLLPWIVGVYKL